MKPGVEGQLAEDPHARVLARPARSEVVNRRHGADCCSLASRRSILASAWKLRSDVREGGSLELVVGSEAKESVAPESPARWVIGRIRNPERVYDVALLSLQGPEHPKCLDIRSMFETTHMPEFPKNTRTSPVLAA